MSQNSTAHNRSYVALAGNAYHWAMGKTLLKSTALFVAIFVAGLLYMTWGSFEYNVPSEQPIYFNQDGSPKR